MANDGSSLPERHEASEGQTQSTLVSPAFGHQARPSLDSYDEQSPLISSQSSQHAADGRLEWDEGKKSGQETKSSWYLILLTLGVGGVQIAWTVELSNGSPYLLSLGMSKALLAFVWIAGPVSGTLVQPYVGIRSDNCRIPWGKRRPFMLWGSAVTILGLLGLAWAKEIVQNTLGVFGADAASNGVRVTTIVWAIILIWVLDFAINAVQASFRAFVVDCAPTHQQEAANAWASRVTGVGNILGYLSGYVDLPSVMPFFGNTQFKVLCVIACLALVGTIGLSSFAIRERDPRLDGPATKVGVSSFFRQMYLSVKRLPPQIRIVCEVQFFNWIGWFPFFFYITTYVGQIYVNPIFAENPNLSPADVDATWEHATRVGTFALLIFALTSFSSNILLPLVVVPTYRAPDDIPEHSFHSPGMQHVRPFTPGTPAGMSASMSSSYFPAAASSDRQSRFLRLLSIFQIRWLTLRRAWLLSHLLFALCMLLTFFITSVNGATALVGLVGVAWALSLWAPFALISAEISKRDAEARTHHHKVAHRSPTQENGPDDSEAFTLPGSGSHDQAGVILGLHNVAIAAPQIIATLVSSVIFRIVQKPRGTAGDTSVAWVLRFGGVAALVAAYVTSRLKEEHGNTKGIELDE